MACPVCFDPYDDACDAHYCYVICEHGGHTVCHTCLPSLTECPICRGPRLVAPIHVRINNDAPAPAPAQPQAGLVLFIDISGSMNLKSGPQDGAPTRIDLAAHMGKVFHAFCTRLGVPCALYAFAEGTRRVTVAELDRLDANGQTNLGLALKTALARHGPQSKYIVFTDGEPTDDFAEATALFAHTQLHLIAFSCDVKVALLNAVSAGGALHSISYVQDVRSISGYMIPVFVCAMVDMAPAVLAPADEATRQRYVAMLTPQAEGHMTPYTLADLRALTQGAATAYGRDLARDTDGHLAESFASRANWVAFGRFYLPCILHCHAHRLPGNAFDLSLKHYRTAAYTRLFDQIADIPMSVPFVARDASQSETASAVVTQSMQYMDTYTSSAGDDGCIGSDALVVVSRAGQFQLVRMDSVGLCDLIAGSHRIKWILCVHNLGHGNLFPLYNGLTGSHPVRHPAGHWIKAKHYPDANVQLVDTIVYDVILEDASVASMQVNGMAAAVVGYPVPGMTHPYWGSPQVIADVKARYPNGGFVDVDAEQFQYTNGLVSSLFSDDDSQ